MTLLLAYADRRGVIVASDRLLTIQRRGKSTAERHTVHANKSIIFAGRDGVMCFAFAGVAYVGKIPTDDWIAEILWKTCPSPQVTFSALSAVMHSMNGRPIRLASAIHNLISRIKNTTELVGKPGGRKQVFELVMGGWRHVRGRNRPFALSWSSVNGFSGMANKAFSEIIVAGGDLSVDFKEFLFNELGEVYNGNGLFREALAKTINFVGERSSTVGEDAMCVEMSWPVGAYRIESAFFANPKWLPPTSEMEGMRFGRELSVTPWLVTPEGYVPPSMISGNMTKYYGNIEVRNTHYGPNYNGDESMVFSFGMQSRDPPPR